MRFFIVGVVFALELVSTLLAAIDYQGWATIIGAIGSAVAAIYAARAHAAAMDANASATGATHAVHANAVTTNTIATATVELEKQGNSRWDEIKKELSAARLEIKGLQQMRVDDAEDKCP